MMKVLIVISRITMIICTIPVAAMLFLIIKECRKGNLKKAAWNAVITVIIVGAIIALGYLTDDENFIRETDTETVSTETADTQISIDTQEEFK
jgi:predicted CDP-diglyceride synthetase/phosphatidate cytidylyltransferase